MSVATQQDITTGTWAIDKVHSHVGFAVKHMVVATFRGRFEDYDGKLTVGENGEPRLEGSVDVDSIVVKDENLAGHLKTPDFFDTAEYPQIRFRSTAVRVGEGGELEVDGELTIKDRTHNVTARGTVSGPHEDIAGNEKIGIELETVVDRREFGLEWNAPLPKGGFALENDVKLEVGLELVKQA
ncbi:MAG TPA: YceI family protein [Solirubrobacteraceae bacterium]|jgi:polyisoprenoid-binding protein YceI|nr:YceI family protein [Solirubrobacteraceae bacterium]